MRYHLNIDGLSLISCYCGFFTLFAITSERLVFPGLALNMALYTSAEHVLIIASNIMTNIESQSIDDIINAMSHPTFCTSLGPLNV